MKVILQQDVKGQGKKGEMIEVSEGLKTQYGVDIPKQKLVLDEPIKAYGSYQVKAKLGFEVSGTVYVTVCEEK